MQGSKSLSKRKREVDAEEQGEREARQLRREMAACAATWCAACSPSPHNKQPSQSPQTGHARRPALSCTSALSSSVMMAAERL